MKNVPIIIDQYAGISAFGTLDETLSALMKGSTAIQPGPCFGIQAGYAPFSDTSLRDITRCANKLKHQIETSSLRPSQTLFVFCAAKGDIRSLDGTSNSIPTEHPSPLLDQQACTIKGLLGFEKSDQIVVSNACASGLIGIETACELLYMNRYTHAVVFGFDVISRFVFSGFHSLGALSPSRARPFDKNRDGLSLGECGALCVLKKEPALFGDALILGSGSSNDANHRTGPSRTGDGLLLAAHNALTNAGITPDQIGAIKCHGTATPYNDAMESKAICRLFNTAIPPCFSVKGALGHTSGAGSLLEMFIALQCIKNGLIPPTVGYAEHGVDEPIPVSAQSQRLTTPTALCLSAGFGGVNAAAVIGIAK